MKTLEDFVMIVDDAITKELSDALFNEYADSDDWLETPAEQGGGVYGKYPASALLITEPAIIGKKPFRKQLARDVLASLRSAFDKYHAKFSRREQGLNFLHIDSMVGLRMIRYQTGQYMANHTDKYPDSTSNAVMWPAVTFTINLNSDFEGGELILLDGDIVFKGETGQGIIFPANFMYPHAVAKVTHGTRYSLAGWFR